MFNDLYDLKQLSGKKHNLSRNSTINEMKNVEELKELANDYLNIVHTEPFRRIKAIRDNFVHNRSSSYFGMDVSKIGNGAYSSGSSRGISTKDTYHLVCELLGSYEQLCEKTNKFIKNKMDGARQDGM